MGKVGKKRKKGEAVDVKKSKKLKLPGDMPKGRNYTVSIALPGSIISQAKSLELRAYLAGQIARAVTIFSVDEVVVYSEDATECVDETYRGCIKSNPNLYLARVLQYLECPQYLRRKLFKLHTDLRFAGLINPLDSPHHLKKGQESRYREGVVVEKETTEGEDSCFVDIGWRRKCKLNKRLKPGTRVTVKLDKKEADGKIVTGKPVPPSRPRKKKRCANWGYSVRVANGIEEVLTKCPWKDGYDITIGTSDKGRDVQDEEWKLRRFNHLLVVFGGVSGLEHVVLGREENGEKILLTEPSKLFDHYINACVDQGTRAIRTEEAILISMSVLWPHIRSNPMI